VSDARVEAVRRALARIADPEIGVNIVDLGLVYDIVLGPGGCRIAMTMTSPACPTGGLIAEEAREAATAALPPGTPVQVDLVWDPPWSPECMSDQAKKHLGW